MKSFVVSHSAKQPGPDRISGLLIVAEISLFLAHEILRNQTIVALLPYREPISFPISQKISDIICPDNSIRQLTVFILFITRGAQLCSDHSYS